MAGETIGVKMGNAPSIVEIVLAASTWVHRWLLLREIAGNASEDRAESRKMAELIAREQCTSDDLARLNLQLDPFPEGRHARGCPGDHPVQKIAGLVGPGRRRPLPTVEAVEEVRIDEPRLDLREDPRRSEQVP